MGKIIVANWKMHGSHDFINTFTARFDFTLPLTENQVIICPPFPFLASFRDTFKGTKSRLGAQNCHTEPQGAFTGEVSASMLADIGCQAVIVGHSERRSLFGETDATVNAKASSVHTNGMTAIICIGENQTVRMSGEAIEEVIRQLKASLPDSSTAQNTLIAYEPIWAIGTGLTPSLDEIQQMHKALYKALKSPIPLLYGGSVTEKNAADILSLPHVDGVLVGGASLHVEIFQKIVRGV